MAGVSDTLRPFHVLPHSRGANQHCGNVFRHQEKTQSESVPKTSSQLLPHRARDCCHLSGPFLKTRLNLKSDWMQGKK